MKILFASIGLAAVIMARAEPGHSFPPVSAADQEKVTAAISTLTAAKPLQPRKVLIFFRTEGFVHESIPIARMTLEELGRKTGAYESVSSDDMAMFDADKLRQFDAVIFVNSTHLSFPESTQRQALLDFVRGGKGLAGIHAASDSFSDWPEMSAVLGGIFHGHPWHSDATVAVKLDDPEHPLNEAFGGKGFWVRDEIYQIDGAYSREHQRTLMSLDMSKPQNKKISEAIVRRDNDFPISWVRTEGKGRVFYCSLGHNVDIFWQPEVLRHYLAGIQYALGDLAADATASAKLKTLPQPAAAPDEAVALQNRKK